ncbi:MAG: HisA/HisF-related TIM barrel protein [Candidatus Methanoperedens sp.]|nr:HisA/HisF-related TIM barrel protein [Candidatus Methanoperedens sp.]
MFRIVFVIDLLDGRVVHAIKGEREKYQPVDNSKVCNSAEPIEMISAVKPKEVYIADLDRLQHTGNNFEVIKKISAFTKTMVNISVEKNDDIEKCLSITDTVILSSEASSFEIMKYASRNYPGKTSVTIDIKNGSILTKDENLKKEPKELVKHLNDLEIKDIVIIDLSKVGTSAGINEDLLREIKEISTHNILFGGGIRDMNDIDALKEIGISGALVATAVHNGKIPIDI